MNLKYKEPQNYSKCQVNKILNYGNDINICNMLIGITFNSNDLTYILDVIDKLSYSKSEIVLSKVFLCLGHLARMYGELPEIKILELYKQYKNNNFVYTDSFLDDVEVFMPDFYEKIQNI